MLFPPVPGEETASYMRTRVRVFFLTRVHSKTASYMRTIVRVFFLTRGAQAEEGVGCLV